MSIQLSKGRQTLFYIALLLTNVIVMHDYVVVPLANTLYELFPNSTAGVNFIISGPAIIMFIASLLVPYLLKFISKKKLLSIVCIVFTVASIFEAAIVSLPYMIFTRSVCGFCYGIVQVVAIDIAADYFVDEDKRASFMGIYNAAMAAIGALMGVLAGNLAVTGWKNAYLTYLLAIPMTILVVFFVPDMKTSSDTAVEEQAADETKAEKVPMGSRFWIMLITFVAFNICYTPMMIMSSVYIAENSLGNEAVAGLAASLGTVGSCICCLGFGFLFSKLKARTSLLSFTVMTLGLLTMHFCPNTNLFLVICVLCGGSYGILFSYVYANAPSIVAPQNTSRAISLLTAGTGFAGFVATYIVTGLMQVVTPHTVTAVALIFGIIVAVCLVIEFFNTGRMKAN